MAGNRSRVKDKLQVAEEEAVEIPAVGREQTWGGGELCHFHKTKGVL